MGGGSSGNAARRDVRERQEWVGPNAAGGRLQRSRTSPIHAPALDTGFVLHHFSVMKNVTITLAEEVARWARVWAARHDTSLSRFLGNILRQKMEEEEGYDRAMQQFLSRGPVPLK